MRLFSSSRLSDMVGKAAKRLYLGVWHSQTPYIYSWSFVEDKTPSYSAFDGIADIRWAFNTVEFDELIEGFENKYRLLGFNTPRFSLLGCVYKITFKTGVIDYGGRRHDRRRSSVLE